MKRTQEEIDRQVNGLKKMRENLPNYNVFGGNNWEIIDVQLNILTGKRTYSYYSNEEQRIESAAYDAKEWLNGENSEDLFDSDETSL